MQLLSRSGFSLVAFEWLRLDVLPTQYEVLNRILSSAEVARMRGLPDC